MLLGAQIFKKFKKFKKSLDLRAPAVLEIKFWADFLSEACRSGLERFQTLEFLNFLIFLIFLNFLNGLSIENHHFPLVFHAFSTSELIKTKKMLLKNFTFA